MPIMLPVFIIGTALLTTSLILPFRKTPQAKIAAYLLCLGGFVLSLPLFTLVSSTVIDRNTVKITTNEKVKIVPVKSGTQVYALKQDEPAVKEGRIQHDGLTQWTIAREDRNGAVDSETRAYKQGQGPTVTHDGGSSPWALIPNTRYELDPTTKLWWGDSSLALVVKQLHVDPPLELHLPEDGTVEQLAEAAGS